MSLGLLSVSSALRAKHIANDGETIQLEIYVCDTTKDSEDVLDYKTWVGLIARAVCETAGGCQVIPGDGYWVRQSDGQLMRDGLSVVKATVSRQRLLENIKRIRYVLVQYGRETEQEKVALSLNGELFVINPAEEY